MFEQLGGRLVGVARAMRSVAGLPGSNPGIHSQVHCFVVALYLGCFSEIQKVLRQFVWTGVSLTDPSEFDEDIALDLLEIGSNPRIHSHLHLPVFSSTTGCFSDIHIIFEQAQGVVGLIGGGGGGGSVMGCVSAARAFTDDGSRPSIYLQLQALVL